MSLLKNALGMGRNMADARMTEMVTIGLFEDRTDPVTLNPIRVLVEERYSGKARVKYPSGAVSNRSEPSQVVAEQDVMLSIPTGSPAAFEGDEVRVDASTADPSLVGRAYGIKGRPQAGQTTSHRYPLKELS